MAAPKNLLHASLTNLPSFGIHRRNHLHACQKTVFVLDHTMTGSSGVKLEMDSFTKPKAGGMGSMIPLLPVTKSLWTCAVESITEYGRIVWDIFPSTRLIRFLAVDKGIHKLLSWNSEDQSLNSLINALLTLGPPKTLDFKPDLGKGLKAAIDALTEPSAIQHEKRTSLSENATKVLNRGRVILVTRIEREDDIKRIREKFQEMLIQANKMATTTDNLMPVNHCELNILNLCPEGVTAPAIPVKSGSADSSTFLSCEVHLLQCGAQIASKVCNLVLRHYDLASTTVTGIPMKEEQNASSSANYDVELFHPAAAHAAILRGAPSETAHLKTVREGADYETVTLKWCTPRSSSSSELQHCSAAHRITSVDVNSRPSSCLTNFLLNGRWVMLEMPRKSGTKVISHILACHGGDIYIHTMYTCRSILEDPPSVSEGCGGRVTDYRIPDFCDFIRANRLAPFHESGLEDGEDGMSPLDHSRDLLQRHTKIWPMTLSSTALFSLGPPIDSLSKLLTKDTLTEEELMKCKEVIFHIMKMETNSEALPSSSMNQRSKGIKREEQYRTVWTELEQYLRVHSYSEAHGKVLACLLECHNKPVMLSSEYKDDKVDIDQALKELDSLSYYPEDKKTEPKHTPADLPLLESKRKKSAPPPLAPLGRSNLLAMWETRLTADQSRHRPEFNGRLKAENNVTTLYPNLQKDKEEKRK